jgi:hypothetical protein
VSLLIGGRRKAVVDVLPPLRQKRRPVAGVQCVPSTGR